MASGSREGRQEVATSANRACNYRYPMQLGCAKRLTALNIFEEDEKLAML